VRVYALSRKDVSGRLKSRAIWYDDCEVRHRHG
jgi:hypothetical protein